MLRYIHILLMAASGAFVACTDVHIANVNVEQFARDYDVTPERFIEKAYNRTLTEDELTYYVLYRLACRLQQRYRQYRDNDSNVNVEFLEGVKPFFTIKPKVGNNIYCAIMSMFFGGGIYFAESSEFLGQYQCNSRTMLINQDELYQHPLRSLFTIEHEITHAEQNFSGNIHAWKRYSEQMDYDEYDADYEASQFVPFPIAIAYEISYYYRDDYDGEYPSQSRVYDWLSRRFHHCDVKKEKDVFMKYSSVENDFAYDLFKNIMCTTGVLATSGAATYFLYGDNNIISDGLTYASYGMLTLGVASTYLVACGDQQPDWFKSCYMWYQYCKSQVSNYARRAKNTALTPLQWIGLHNSK